MPRSLREAAAACLLFAVAPGCGPGGKKPPLKDPASMEVGCGFQVVPYEPPEPEAKVVQPLLEGCSIAVEFGLPNGDKTKECRFDPTLGSMQRLCKDLPAEPVSRKVKFYDSSAPDAHYVIVEDHQDTKGMRPAELLRIEPRFPYYILIRVKSYTDENRPYRYLPGSPSEAYQDGDNASYCMWQGRDEETGIFTVDLFRSSKKLMHDPDWRPASKPDKTGPEYFKDPVMENATLRCSPTDDSLFAIRITTEEIVTPDAPYVRRPFGINLKVLEQDARSLQVIPNPQEIFTVLSIPLKETEG